MPPKTVWTFTECYTFADILKEKVTAPYSETVKAVREQVKALGNSDYLDSRLPDFAENISLQKGRTVLKGSGYGYLNGLLGGKIPAQLEFTQNDDVKGWISLINGEKINTDLSFAYGEKTKELLLKKQNICNWNIAYQLSLVHHGPFTLRPQENGEAVGIPHKSKAVSQVSESDSKMPDWFINGVKSALLAPTAMNQQKFKFTLKDDRVIAKAGIGFYTKIDLGIVKYHFEIGAGKENFEC